MSATTQSLRNNELHAGLPFGVEVPETGRSWLYQWVVEHQCAGTRERPPAVRGPVTLRPSRTVAAPPPRTGAARASGWSAAGVAQPYSWTDQPRDSGCVATRARRRRASPPRQCRRGPRNGCRERRAVPHRARAPADRAGGPSRRPVCAHLSITLLILQRMLPAGLDLRPMLSPAYSSQFRSRRFFRSSSSVAANRSRQALKRRPIEGLQGVGNSPSLTGTLTCCRPRSTFSVMVSPGL